ncbi:MAG TPA: hypothetical protein DEB39_05320 [Planctomycetaceae bacterium]|nr:hypothetical protein [Planctomycetaceae bacterium]
MRFVFFDLGNVIVKFSIEKLLHQAAAVVGRDADMLYDVIFDTHLQHRHERGEITEDEYYDTFCDRIGVRVRKDVLLSAISDIFTFNTPMLPVMAYFAERDIPRGILSNTAPAHWNHCRATYPEIHRLIPSNHVLSYEVGAMKPDRRIYETAFQTSARIVPGITPSEILFIDDLEQNIAAARDFGFDAVRYLDDARLAQSLRERGIMTG